MDDYHQLIAQSVINHGIRLKRPIDYIEVGVLTGNSAEAVLSTGYSRHAVLIDNFSNTYCGDWKSSREQVEKRLAEYSGTFEIEEGDSRKILPRITEHFDIGFVDGDHSIEGCTLDLNLTWPLIREDGILFVDDMDDPQHIRGIVTRFAHEKRLSFTHHHVHQGLGELTRKLKT